MDLHKPKRDSRLVRQRRLGYRQASQLSLAESSIWIFSLGALSRHRPISKNAYPGAYVQNITYLLLSYVKLQTF